MHLKTLPALIGALIAVAVVAALYLTFHFLVGWQDLTLNTGLIALGVVAGLVLLSYVLASVGAAPTGRATGFGEFMRGWLLGLNAGLNGILAMAVVSLFAPLLAAVLVGAILGVLNLLAVLGPVSKGELYQGILGWLNWLLPMSWLIVALGLVFYLICLVGVVFSIGRVAYLRIKGAGVDWKTGTFFLKGGLISNLNPIDTAFNMGNFAFVDKDGDPIRAYKEHEAGHTLNLAAFGSLFHLIGAVDENVLSRGYGAFAERLAQSNVPGGGSQIIPMWD